MTPPPDRRHRADAAGFTLRRPTVADAAELATVHLRAWQEAYTGLINPDYLDDRRLESRTAQWAHILSTPESGRASTWLALDSQGAIVGFGSSAWARDADAPVEVELWALYLLARAYGSGAADLLVHRLIGDRPAYLWVVDGNDRAIAFYRRQGFVPDGVTKDDEELGVRELRMVRNGR